MIDIPVGKALVAVENLNHKACQECAFRVMNNCSKHICCTNKKRNDKKDVVFQLADYPPNAIFFEGGKS